MFAITAVIYIFEKNDDGKTGYTGTRHTPIFYLDPRVQGITNEEQAKEIALEILDPDNVLRNDPLKSIIIYADRV
jgi:hypothetical protein